MKYHSIDWSKIEDYLCEVPECTHDVAQAYAVHKKIDEAFNSDRELIGLNLPVYVLGFADRDPDEHESRVFRLHCGYHMSHIPIKNIQIIENVVPCNKSLFVMDKIRTEYNESYRRKYPAATHMEEVQLISLVTLTSTYLVLMSYEVFYTARNLWLAQLA